MKTKKIIFIIILLAIAGLGAFRAAQVISAKKAKDPKRQGMGQAPLAEIAPVTQGLVEEKMLRTGDIASYAQVTIYSKVQGWVEKIHVREGDRVKIGQVLATLDARVSTLLTLVFIPTLYTIFEPWLKRKVSAEGSEPT